MASLLGERPRSGASRCSAPCRGFLHAPDQSTKPVDDALAPREAARRLKGAECTAGVGRAGARTHERPAESAVLLARREVGGVEPRPEEKVMTARSAKRVRRSEGPNRMPQRLLRLLLLPLSGADSVVAFSLAPRPPARCSVSTFWQRLTYETEGRTRRSFGGGQGGDVRIRAVPSVNFLLRAAGL